MAGWGGPRPPPRSLGIDWGLLPGIASIAFDPTGAFVLTANADGTARIWDTATGDEVEVLSGARRPLLDAVFTPGWFDVIAGGRDGKVRTWRCEACQPLDRLIAAATASRPRRVS